MVVATEWKASLIFQASLPQYAQLARPVVPKSLQATSTKARCVALAMLQGHLTTRSRRTRWRAPLNSSVRPHNMTLLRVLVSIIVPLVVSACAGTRSAATVAKPAIPQTAAECAARGGSWTTLGLPYPGKPRVCDLQATDSGKVCSDSSECQGSCLASDSAASGVKTTGTCSAYVSNFGNVKLVEHGKVVLLNVE